MRKTPSTKNKMNSRPEVKPASVDEWIAAAQEAVRAALREHKRAGNHVAVWQDGHVVLIPPEQIKV